LVILLDATARPTVRPTTIISTITRSACPPSELRVARFARIDARRAGRRAGPTPPRLRGARKKSADRLASPKNLQRLNQYLTWIKIPHPANGFPY